MGGGGGSVFGHCFVIQHFFNHLDGEERAGYFALTVLLMSCDSQCSDALLPSAEGWSAVCDCGIS